MRFDLKLFEELNRQYSDKPVHAVRSNAAADVIERGRHRARWLDRRFGVRGKRCLEVGCGRGEVVRALSAQYGCDAVGVDVQRYDEWALDTGARILCRDVSREPIADLGRFDLIFSFSVWEHVRRPYEALQAVKKLLAPGGDFYLSANLHRGSQASHRYGEVFFPWPHLLFDDSVFEAFYARRGQPGKRAAWVNRLSAAEYLAYFRELGLSVMHESYSGAPFDEAFYRRFEDVLGRYPRADLERDFIKVHLRHTPRWRRAARSLVALEVGQLSTRAGYALRLLSERLRRPRAEQSSRPDVHSAGAGARSAAGAKAQAP